MYQQIENANIANQIHGFTIDYGKINLDLIEISLFFLLIKIQKHPVFVARISKLCYTT